MDAATAFELAAVAATSVGFVFAVRQHEWSRRLRMAACDVVMVTAMVDSSALGHSVVPPLLWVMILIVVALASTVAGAGADRSRRGGVLVSIAMLVMAGLIGHSAGPPAAAAATAAHGAHAGGFGSAVAVATVAYVVIASVAAGRLPRGSGRGHAVATVGSVALMALGCVV
jgi:hypothetical protein